MVTLEKNEFKASLLDSETIEDIWISAMNETLKQETRLHVIEQKCTAGEGYKQIAGFDIEAHAENDNNSEVDNGFAAGKALWSFLKLVSGLLNWRSKKEEQDLWTGSVYPG